MRAILLRTLRFVPMVGVLGGCLDPLVSDEVSRPELVLAKGSVPLAFTTTAAGRAQIAQNDGLPDDDEVIWLRSAFAHGEATSYWDFGEAAPQPIPLYMLVTADPAGPFAVPEGTFAPVPGHPPIFDAVPGDPGYSPWWSVVLWPVTERYDGEVIASFSGMEEAFRQGLVSASVTVPSAVNCPVVLPEARLQVAPGSDERELPQVAYYRGTTVYYFSFSMVPIRGPSVAVTPLYSLRREGGEPLSEPVRGVDFTRDGDMLDTNDIFALRPSDSGYSGTVQIFETIVQAEHLIDGDAAPELTDARQLFSGSEPDPAHVVALYPTGVVVNRPLWEPR